MKVTETPIASIKPYAKNPRLNDKAVDAVAKSLDRFGFQQPIVVDKNGRIVVGHTRLKAAIKLGMLKVPVVTASELTPAEIKAYRIADNQTASIAEWDLEILPDELHELQEMDFPLDLLGFDDAELQRHLDHNEESDGSEDIIPQAGDPVTRSGDLWEMGQHRLLCGDCRVKGDVAKLIGKTKINLAITSPPYAQQRKYDEASGFKGIICENYVDWFDKVQASVAHHLADDGSWIVNIKEHCEDGQRVLYVKDLTLAHVRKWGWRFVDEYVWTHGGTPKAVQRRFKNGWEPVFMFTRGDHKFRPDAVMHASGSVPDWNGKHPSQNDGQGLRQTGSNSALEGTAAGGKAIHDCVKDHSTGVAYPSNVLTPGKNKEALGHGAAFPVALPEFFIKAYTDKGDAVFDPFMGSGTTMIACEREGRNGFGMELSPAYCDIIVKRWETMTDLKAVRHGKG